MHRQTTFRVLFGGIGDPRHLLATCDGFVEQKTSVKLEVVMNDICNTPKA